VCAALSLEPLSALRPLRECVWVTRVGSVDRSRNEFSEEG